MNQLQIFKNEEFGEIRFDAVYADIDSWKVLETNYKGEKHE